MAPYTRRMPNPARYPHNSCFLTALSQRVSDTTALPSTQKDEGQGVGGLRETALRLGVVPYFPRRFAEIRTRRARPLAIKLTCSTTPPCKAPSAVGASADFSPLEKKNLNAANPEKTGAGGGVYSLTPDRKEDAGVCSLSCLPAPHRLQDPSVLLQPLVSRLVDHSAFSALPPCSSCMFSHPQNCSQQNI